MRRWRTSGLAVLAMLAAGAVAQAQDAPISTSNGSAAPKAETTAPAPVAPAVARTTAEQIDEYFRSSPALAPGADGEALADDGVTLDRGVHGEVSVGVGTHGYREVYVRAETPVGARGRLSVAVGETRGNWLGGSCGPVELNGPDVLRLDRNCLRRSRPVFPLPAE